MGIESLNTYTPIYPSSAFVTPSFPVNISSRTNNNQYILVKSPEGKYVRMTKDEFIRWINSQQNKPSTAPANPYELGPEKGGKRVIDVDNVTEPLHPGSSAPKDHSCPPEKIEEYENNILNGNGEIDNFRQGKRGDCYLLSTIESIRLAKDGENILSKNYKKNSDGSYTVVLPGAIAARNHYIEQGNGDKCAITGHYTITAAAIEKAQKFSGMSYAYGDLEVIIFELAMEAFRAEVNETNKALGQQSEKYIAGQFGPMSSSDTLSGGQMYDAVFILTGQKSDIYEAPKAKRRKAKLYRPGEYGYVGEKKCEKLLGAGASRDKIVEVNNIYDKDSDLQRMLDSYKGREDEFTITVGVIVAKNGPDGSTKAGGGHALTVKKITDDYVEVVNPWDTTKAERIPRGDFEKMAMHLNVAPISNECSDKFFEENNIPNLHNENLLADNPISRLLKLLFS